MTGVKELLRRCGWHDAYLGCGEQEAHWSAYKSVHEWSNDPLLNHDGTHFLTGDDEGRLRLWPAPKVWPDLLCAKLSRNMSQMEWRDVVSADIAYHEQCPGLPIRA